MKLVPTFSGMKFDPESPSPDAVCIGDIAHSLSNMCRFQGHCQSFYSVAQHSVIVSRMLRAGRPSLRLWGLLHDAPEAYTGFGDVCGPLKPSALAEQECRIMTEAIAPHFGLTGDMPAAVHSADRIALGVEASLLLGISADELRDKWNVVASNLIDFPKPLLPFEAHAEFLLEFETITAAREIANGHG